MVRISIARPVRAAVAACLLVLPAAGVLAQDPSLAPASAAPLTETDRLAAAEARIAELEAENGRLRGFLLTWEDLYDPMEADRQLLLELRKDLPDDEAAARAYIERIRDLAFRSDPARLSQDAVRLMETAPTWLDWRFGEYADDTARAAEYLRSGAAGFDQNLRELRDTALLVAAGHIDAILTLADRAR